MKHLPMAIFLLFAIFVVSSAWHTDEEVNSMYESWLVKHGKFYKQTDLAEKEKRLEIFKDNLRYIEDHNSGDHSYELGLNQFADLTVEEYRLRYTNTIPTPNSNSSNNDMINDLYSPQALPESVDWRSTINTPVKNQGSCGCSYAFAATAALEGILNIVTGGPYLLLSEQHIVDCTRESGNGGCSYGLAHTAFQHIKDKGGLTYGRDYPYTATVGTCQSLVYNRRVTIKGYSRTPMLDEFALQEAVSRQPVAAGINASPRSFMLYTKGIYNDPLCIISLPLITDLAFVTVYGYGTENGMDYWLTKNSWSDIWGEKGYMRIRRNTIDKAGRCGITMMASYPWGPENHTCT